MVDSGFLWIAGALMLAVVGSTLFWMRAKQSHKHLTKMYYLVPLIIILVISGILMMKTVWDVENINIRYERKEGQLLDNKWHIVEDHLMQLQQENFVHATTLAQQIIDKLSALDAATLDFYLENLPCVENPIQQAVDTALFRSPFRGITNDANDPLAMVIGRDDSDSFIFSDFSQNCSLDEGVRTNSMEQEYALMGRDGNRALGEATFRKIIALEAGETLYDTLYIQFEARSTELLEPYNFLALRELFFQLDGNVYRTFESIEFLAPYYIYRDQAISGSPRTVDRMKTDARIIAIISIFNYIDVLARDPYMTMQLEQVDNAIALAEYERLLEERSTLIVGLLMMLVIFVLLILFWVFMHLNIEDKIA